MVKLFLHLQVKLAQKEKSDRKEINYSGGRYQAN